MAEYGIKKVTRSQSQELKDFASDLDEEKILRIFGKSKKSPAPKLQNIKFQVDYPAKVLKKLVNDMSGSRFYGVELDSITGQIAQLLYPKNRIAIQGFESADFQDSFFDVAIGNVPFGQFKVLDKRYDKYNFLIHDYFFAKALDKVRPGGLVLFITSKGTMIPKVNQPQDSGKRRTSHPKS